VGCKNDGPITVSSLVLPPRPVPPTLLFDMETYVSSGGNEALRVSGHSPLFSTESRNKWGYTLTSSYILKVW